MPKQQRKERVDNEVKRLQGEATRAWLDLKKIGSLSGIRWKTVVPAKSLGCVVFPSTLSVTLKSGVEQVKADCGMKEEVFDSISRKVEVAELEEAQDMKKKLTPSHSVCKMKLQEAGGFYYGDEEYEKDDTKARSLYKQAVIGFRQRLFGICTQSVWWFWRRSR